MALGIDQYPRIIGDEFIKHLVEMEEAEALNVAMEAVRMVRRMRGDGDDAYDRAVTAKAFYEHPSLAAGQLMSAWIEEWIRGNGTYLYTQPVIIGDSGDITELSPRTLQAHLELVGDQPNVMYPAYQYDGIQQLSDENRLLHARDVFETAAQVQKSQETVFFDRLVTAS